MQFESGTYRVDQLINAGVLDVGDGYRAKNSELSASGLPFARAGNINVGFRFVDADRFPESQLHKVGGKVSRPGDVVFTSKGTVGRFAFVTQHVEKFVYSPQLCFWRSLDTKILDPCFLFYWMQGPEFMGQVDYLKGQTDMADYVSLRDQRRMSMTLVPLPVQQDIAAILGALDDRIDLLRQTNTTLESIAQALFKSWFIDFDPVRAKQASREPEGMDAATAALFPAEFEESALGLIPKGWRLGTIEDLLVLQRGFDLPASQRTQGQFPVLAASGPSSSHHEAMVKGPGVTTGRSGVIGNVYFVHEDFWPLNTSLWVKEFRLATPIFAYQFLKTLDLKRLNAGSAVPTLNRNHVHAQPALLPPSEVVAAFTSVVSALLARGRANEMQAETLSAVRDTLLPRLISGKLRLPEAQEQLEDALA